MLSKSCHLFPLKQLNSYLFVLSVILSIKNDRKMFACSCAEGTLWSRMCTLSLPLGLASKKQATEKQHCVDPDGTQERGGDVSAGTGLKDISEHAPDQNCEVS